MLFSGIGHAAIYGVDDRKPIVQAPAAIQDLASSVFLLVPNNFIHDKGSTFDLETYPMSESSNLCPNVKGAQSPAFSVGCTGFLVAPDIMATAGHCMINHGETKNEFTPQCENFSWVADYKEESDGKVQTKGLAKDRLVECERVIYAVHNSVSDPKNDEILEFKRDLALVKLKRPIGRPVLKLAPSTPNTGASLTLLGHPLAGPSTWTPNGKVLSLEPAYIRANLDAFPGNSGSPVFNDAHEVIGILVRGYPDSLIDDRRGQCNKLNYCNEKTLRCDVNDPKIAAGEHIEPIHFLREKLQPLLEKKASP